MTLTNNELLDINGGSYLTNLIRIIRIHIKYFIVKYIF